MSRLFCFGLGYSAETLAKRLAAKGWSIAGTARDLANIERLRGQGYEVVPLHRRSRAMRSWWQHLQAPRISSTRFRLGLMAIRCCVTIAPRSRVSRRSTGSAISQPLASMATAQAPWSTRAPNRIPTMIGRGRGSWPRAAGSRLARRSGRPAQVFRLAGIYGPGRSALDKLRAGTARRIVKPGQVFNRIHVEDIASVLEASIARPRAGAIYNVADDEPAPPEDVVTYAAELLASSRRRRCRSRRPISRQWPAASMATAAASPTP